MDKAKAQALKLELARCCEDCEVDYAYSDNLHKFSVNCGRPNCLYIYSDFLSQHTKDELIDILHDLSIPEMLRASPQARRLALGRYGIRDVILLEQ